MNRQLSSFASGDVEFAICFLTVTVVSFASALTDHRTVHKGYNVSPNAATLRAVGADHVDDYVLTVPRVYHRQPLVDTPTRDGYVTFDLSLALDAFNETLVLDLQVNRPQPPTPSVLCGLDITEPMPSLLTYTVYNTETNCFYRGQVRGHQHSSAAISTCRGIRGQIVVDDVVYHVEPRDEFPSIKSLHYVIRHAQNNKTNDNGTSVHRTATKRLRRESDNANKISSVKDYLGHVHRFVELYIVNDYSQFVALKRNEDAVIQRTKDIVNILSQIYRQLDIHVVLVGVEVWNKGNKINVTGDATETMTNFLDYRRKVINKQHPNDNAQLIIGEILGVGVVGKAPIMTICTHRSSGGVSSDRHSTVGAIAATVAHEIGHNFGLQHDDDSACGCPDDRCIMSSSGSGWRYPTRWSECSLHQLSDSFHQGVDYCLRNQPTVDRVFDGPTCGNGIVENGEQCDCGLRSECKNSCCDPSKCTLAVNASCASGLCCDLNKCQIAAGTDTRQVKSANSVGWIWYNRQQEDAGSECRASTGYCDLGEYCDGHSSECPADVHLQDGVECSTTRGVSSYCYQGECKSREAQCQLLWGPTGRVSHSLCFEHFNILGTVNGHCGFSWTDERFTKCPKRDVMCGALHCSHASERLMFSKEMFAYSTQETWVTTRDEQRHDCKSVVLDVGLNNQDPGSVLDGTKCGDQQICIGHRCQDLAILNVTRCPDCNGRGVCNSLGQCHCEVGYSPPDCKQFGYGGSTHSGPAVTSAAYLRTGGVSMIIGLTVLCLVLIPTLVITTYFAYSRRSQLKKVLLHRCHLRDQGHSVNRVVQMSFVKVEIKTTTADSDNCSSIEASPMVKRSSSIRRVPSFRPEDISAPKFQSSTNSALSPLISQGGSATESSSIEAPLLQISLPAATDGWADEVLRVCKETIVSPTEQVQRTAPNVADTTSRLDTFQTDNDRERLQPTRKAPPPPSPNISTVCAMGTKVAAAIYVNSPSPTRSNNVPKAALQSNTGNRVQWKNDSRSHESCATENNATSFEAPSPRTRPARPPPPQRQISSDRCASDSLSSASKSNTGNAADVGVSVSFAELKKKFSDSYAASGLSAKNLNETNRTLTSVSAVSGSQTAAAAAALTAGKSTVTSVTRSTSVKPGIPPKPLAKR